MPEPTTQQEREAFEAWWAEKGQFTRVASQESADGELERAFARAGWQAARSLPPTDAPRVREWMPIETVPRDGREVILRRGERVATAGWVTWPATEEHDSGEGWTISHDGDSWDEGNEPTHWQPLPAPPTAIDAALAQQEGGSK